MKTANTTPKATKTPKATFVGPVAPTAPVVPPTLQVQPAPTVQAAPAAPTAVTYAITAKAAVIAPHLTLQRGCAVPVGAQWRANGHKALNTRHIVIAVLAALGNTFTHDAAIAALAPLKADATLGSGTPTSYLRAFVKCGYLAVQGAA